VEKAAALVSGHRGHITVVVTAIPQRRLNMLPRALTSVAEQWLAPMHIVVSMDLFAHGAAKTRDRGLDMVTTEYVAFLDDDDWFYPQHLHLLRDCLQREDADLVYPWFDVEGGRDPFPPNFEFDPWDPLNPHQTTICFLAKTDVLREHGGFDADFTDEAEDPGVDAQGNRSGEEFRLVCRINEAGGRIVHLPERTFCWRHHPANSSGLASRVLWGGP